MTAGSVRSAWYAGTMTQARSSHGSGSALALAGARGFVGAGFAAGSTIGRNVAR